jgi:hypothetical protein
LSDTPVKLLVVMRLGNMQRVHPGQDNSRTCARCGERVGIYPSGQQVIAAHPEFEIVCEICIERTHVDLTFLAPGAECERAESVPAKTGKEKPT